MLNAHFLQEAKQLSVTHLKSIAIISVMFEFVSNVESETVYFLEKNSVIYSFDLLCSQWNFNILLIQFTYLYICTG